MEYDSLKNIKIQIKGLVQGVGFRPFVYRMARKTEIYGWVKNRQDGLIIEASGSRENIQCFILSLKNEIPTAAQIHDFQTQESKSIHKNKFEIVLSEDDSNKQEITQIGSDIAICPDCLEDLKTQAHRLNYPFINCTNCGPRFSIIRDLPYDRDKTTMDIFDMCPICKSEYENPADRRFHAQPIACLNCGPHYKFISKYKETEDFNIVIKLTSDFIDTGKIVAIKGIGGFFIACDAKNNEAVQRLRKLKSHEGKPLAVMFRDVETIQQNCYLNVVEKDSLLSWKRPIVILKSKNKFPESISNGINTVGALLPYMPRMRFDIFHRFSIPGITTTSSSP